ncbi:Per1-like membrane protein [Tubulinosema ratisbonensis]|uniref:Post-GPI attachment to proteins factor 3 n=1 Tax=Tubulinosema ratisbonensis TaxID=291195 RepID=A0A437ANH5_9MICR|nr:Per1-like membrane protein [Tubulinosema ratisbonensis]
MHEQIAECFKRNLEIIKINLFDRLLFRPLDQKVIQHCVYQCCKKNTILKYKHEGRYPFMPLFGCTEFASAIFSLLNLFTNTYGYFKYLHRIKGTSTLCMYYKLTYLVNVFTWLSSTLFHINDTNLTRNLDYFFALLNLMVSFYTAFLRILVIFYKKDEKILFKKTVFGILFSYYFMHIYYLTYIHFNYDLHKMICAFLIVTILCMYGFIAYSYKMYPHVKYLLISGMAIFFSCLVEIGDTPPLFYLFDSHACFHLITGIFAPSFYVFLREDLIFLKKLK